MPKLRRNLQRRPLNAGDVRPPIPLGGEFALIFIISSAHGWMNMHAQTYMQISNQSGGISSTFEAALLKPQYSFKIVHLWLLLGLHGRLGMLCVLQLSNISGMQLSFSMGMSAAI